MRRIFSKTCDGRGGIEVEEEMATYDDCCIEVAEEMAPYDDCGINTWWRRG